MKKRIISALSIILVLSMALACVSCAVSVSAEELSEGYERKATETGEVDGKFISEMYDFAFDLFRGTLTKDNENDLVSPLSAVLCLGMIANGADGNTKEQMENALGMSVEDLNKSLYAYTLSLGTSDDCKINLANSIWFRNQGSHLHVSESFLQTNADWYRAQVYSAPFDKTTLDDINSWCRQHTDGMIKKMIDEIDNDAVMYLINALVFDAKWAEEYEKDDIDDGTFRNYDGTESKVDMLSSDESVYFNTDTETGFAKNYIGGKYSFVGLLPNEGTDIYDYISNLDGEYWQKLWDGRENGAVSVKMPEFTYSVNMELNDTLKAMGMTDMFDGSAADFSKLGYSDYGNISCSEVCQKTFIQVDRNGTKAAAITWGTINITCYMEIGFEVILDRPFVYAIVDNSTGLPIFLGAVTQMG